MTRRGRGRTALALVFCMAMIAAGCGDSAEEGGGDDDTTQTTVEAARSDTCRTIEYEDAPQGGELVDYAQLSSAGDNTSFDPGAVQTLDEAQITNALFDGLLDFDYSDTCAPVLKPLVAEELPEVNADATVFTFKIKDDLEFSNGEAIKPSNFKIAWERAGSAELASSYGYLMTLIKGGSDLLDGTVTTLDSIVADDDAMTLEVTLESPQADFPAISTFSSFSPISKADYEKIGNTTGWGKAGITIGNGPYMLESAESPDSGSVVIVKNPKWAGDINGDKTVNLDKITFMLTTDVASAYQAFDAGEGDTSTIPPGQYSAARAKYPNTVDSAVLGTYFFDFGFADATVGGDDNLKLRQAISLAIDRDEINEKVYEGARVVSTGITPPGIPGFKADICDYCKTDPTEAKKLFDEWTADGGSVAAPIKISFNSGGGHEDVAAIIQANVKAALGIDIELNSIEEDYFKVIAEEGACQICRSGWYADYPTYGNFMVDLFGAVSIDGNNLGRYDDSQFEDFIGQAAEETDATKRGELYNQAEERLLNGTTSAIPLNWYTGDQVYREGIVNYILQPLGLYAWEKVGKPS